MPSRRLNSQLVVSDAVTDGAESKAKDNSKSNAKANDDDRMDNISTLGQVSLGWDNGEKTDTEERRRRRGKPTSPFTFVTGALNTTR